MKTEAERNADMNCKELQLEFTLAKLLWPDYQISYNDHGYWYANDVRIPMPNFKHYVPKWTRDDAAAFELAATQRVWPTQLFNGICYQSNEERPVVEMYDELQERSEYESEVDFHRRMARLVIVQAVIWNLQQKNKYAILKSIQRKRKES